MSPALSEDHAPASLQPGLYVVATPIGNLGDITSRAAAVLRGADVIAAEDTRHSARLLQHLAVHTPMIAYHDFSTSARQKQLVDKLDAGLVVALISDAGTPLISDPGYALVREARKRGIAVIAVPGVSALTAAMSVAGLPTDRFAFEGFPAGKSAARRRQFEALAQEERTLVFYESPHRIEACVNDMREVFGADREAVICRELTKTWETVHGDTLDGLLGWLQADADRQRGEIVLLLKGAVREKGGGEIDAEAERVLEILLEELPVSRAASLAARITGIQKKRLYRLALEKT